MSIAIPENPADAHTLLNRLTMGEVSIDVAGSANVALSDQQAQYDCLVFTGVLTGNIDVLVPAEAKGWDVHNATSGAYTLTVKASGTTGVAVTQGTRVRLRYSPHAADVVSWAT